MSEPGAPNADSDATLPPPNSHQQITAPSLASVPADSATLPPTFPPSAAAVSGSAQVPGYEILSELGRGGMGVVYKARQQRPSRSVALKMILAGAHASTQELNRFIAEAEAIARLQHPNIVQIFEFGKHGEQPYFSLEFCDGGSLAGKLAGTPLPPREGAQLIRTLAVAVQAAHDAGIVHRDLKPHNVLLLADGTPKITDFGLAKQAGSDLTASGAIMGTPSYMAPEQADPRKGNIGPGADVYALGAILYECLTGRPPFRASTPLDTILQVVNDEPVAPSQLNHQVPRDLETIVLKCLQKDPRRRYGSATALAEDLRCYLNDEPISARATGRLERFGRWCRKSPWRAAALFGCAGLLGLSIGLLISMVDSAGRHARELSNSLTQSQEAEIKAVGEKNRADKEAAIATQRAKEAREALDTLQSERDRAKHIAYAANVSGAFADWQLLNSHRARQLLEGCEEKLRGWEWEFLRKQFEDGSLPLRGHSNGPFTVALSLDGAKACTLGFDKTVRMWDTQVGVELYTLPVQAHLVAMSQDGRRLALAVGRGVLVYDIEAEREVRRFDAGDIPAGLGFVLGGKQLGVATLGGGVTFRDPETGNTLKTLPKRLTLDDATRQLINLGHGVAFSPDGKWLAQGGEGKVHVWDAATGAVHFEGEGHIKLVGQVAFRPDSKQLASPGGEGDVRLWDVENKSLLRKLTGHRSWAWRVAWSADGSRLISCAKDTTARIWDPETGDTLLTLRGHASEVWGCALSADGRRAATASPDRSARIWDTRDRVIYGEHVAKFFREKKLEDFGRHGFPEFLSFYGHVAPCGAVALSPDGRLAATSAMGDDQAKHQVTVWDLDARREVLKVVAPAVYSHTLDFSPDGKQLAIGTGSAKKGEPTTVRVVAVSDGKEISRWQGPAGLFPHVKFTPRGERLVITIQANAPSLPEVSLDGKCWLASVDPATGKEHYRHGLPGTATRPSVNGDGTEIVVADTSRSLVQAFDTATGKLARSWTVPGHGLSDTACGPTGVVAAASIGADGGAMISLWKLADGAKLRDLEGHVGIVMRMAFSPDGSRLLSCASDFTARLWNVESGRELLTFRDHNDIPLAVAWSTDGRRIATGCKDGGMRVWQGPAGAAAEVAWTVLYKNDFSDPAARQPWQPAHGSQWEVVDGVLRGRHALAKEPVVFSVAHATLTGIEMPKNVDVSFRYRMSKPMVLGATFAAAEGYKRSFTPLLAARCQLQGSPMTFLMKLTSEGLNGADMRISNVGLPRKFDAEADRWYRVRILREPTRMSVWVDDRLILQENIPDVDLPQLGLQGSWGAVGDIIEFDDLVIKSRTDAAREQELRALVRQTFPKVLLRDETVQRIAAEHKISAHDRAILERLTLEHREEPTKISEAAWRVVYKPGSDADALALALKQCEAVLRFAPDDHDSWSHLCLTRLRVGQYEQAIADARKALELTRRQTGAGWPLHQAVLAMAHHHLGKTAAARRHLHHLRDMLLSDAWRSRPVADGFVKEAEKLLGPDAAATAEDNNAALIKQTITRAEQDGWLRHDVASYLRSYAADAVVREGRTDQPGPHDIVLTRKQFEAMRRVEFRSPPPKADSVFFTFEDMEVQIENDMATWRARWTVHFGPNFESTGVVYRLRRQESQWKVTSARFWPIAQMQGQEYTAYDANGWKRLDAVADALNDSADLAKRIQALRAARRFAEGYALAVDVTKNVVPIGATRNDHGNWLARGDLAFKLGNVDDARLALAKAEKLDPSQPLPWYASRRLRVFQAHQATVGGVAFLPDGKRIVSAGADGVVRLWEAATLKESQPFRATGALFSAALAKDGKLVAAGGDVAHVWDIANGKKIFANTEPLTKVERLHFSPDGKRIVAASADKFARVWDLESKKLIMAIEHHGGEVIFHPDGKSIFVAGQDSKASLIELSSNKPLRIFEGHGGEVKRLAISPDGTKAATADARQVVRLWNVDGDNLATSKQVHKLVGAAIAVGVLRFSPDGSRLAVGDVGGNVHLWDVATGKLVLKLRTDEAAVLDISFAPDGRTLATSGHAGVQLWDLQSQLWAE